MEHYLNEKTVMKFYLDQMEKDNIIFLQKKPELKEDIKKLVTELSEEDKMNSKIKIATKLWKKLFEASMTYISPNKQGYDKIFQYFDSYVEFEELIFASDSFYRDHTLHCLWVYFLGEYIRRNEEFDPLFEEERQADQMAELIADIMEQLGVFDIKKMSEIRGASETTKEILMLDESVRCVAALTHDLGYPLKKIEKINKSIKKVLPYFAINNFDDFTFEYENIQQEL